MSGTCQLEGHLRFAYNAYVCIQLSMLRREGRAGWVGEIKRNVCPVIHESVKAYFPSVNG